MGFFWQVYGRKMGLLSSVSFLLFVFAWATPCFSVSTADSVWTADDEAIARARNLGKSEYGPGSSPQFSADPPVFSSSSEKEPAVGGVFRASESECKSCHLAGYKAVGSRSTQSTEGLVNARSDSNDPIGRALGALTTSDYDTKFTDESRRILKAYNLFNKRMVRDSSINPTSESLEWTQVSRCFWKCEEEYLLVDYYQDGDKSNPVMKVFVAKSELSPPSEFRTSGYQGYLHFGFLYYGGQNQAFFFVLHPNSWGPYQHRFKTNSFTAFFQDGIGAVLASGATYAAGAAVTSAAAAAGAAAAGATIGSIVPVAGTIIGGLVGASVGALSDDYFGDYLRYIG